MSVDMVKIIETIVAIIEVIAAIWLGRKARSIMQTPKPPDSKPEVKK